MLRSIGKEIPLNSVTLSENQDSSIEVIGKLGKIKLVKPKFLDVVHSKESVVVSIKEGILRNEMAMAGTFVAILKQSILGVTSGHSRVVIVTGTGSNVKVVQDKLLMRLGKSHPVEKNIPNGVTCVVESSDIRQTRLRISGVNEQQVGQFASELRIKRAYAGGIHAWVEGDLSMIKKRKGGK